VNEKTKVIEVSGVRYQLRRFAPDAGSFILMQIIGAGTKGQTGEAPATDSVTPKAERPSGEDLVRAVVFSAFLHGLDFDMHRFVQAKCLSLCSRLEGPDGDTPMPLANATGQVNPALQDDMGLVMKLEMEVLVFNLSPFFEGEGLKALAGARPTSKA
jgi:hypothetical protein